jgi:hypothetical protein
MLGRLEMDIQHCLQIYRSLMGIIFEPKHWIRVSWTGQIISKYDSEKLANEIRKVLFDMDLPSDALLNDGQERRCRV